MFLLNQQMLRPLLARDVVRYVGEPVAAVVAETRAQATDAAELVIVDYDPLEAVVDASDVLIVETLMIDETTIKAWEKTHAGH